MDGHKSIRLNQFLGWGMVGLGLLFVVLRALSIDPWRFFWPFFVIAPGLLFFLGMALGGKQLGSLAIPGSIITMTGLILLYQNLTGHWTSWAYVWTLIFPVSVGLGLLIWSVWSDNPGIAKTGSGFIRIGLIVFLAGLVFFELILDISGLRRGFTGRFLLPIVLVVAGVYLLAVRGDRSEDETMRLGTEPPANG